MTSAADFSILEEDLTNQLSQLKKELHMRRIRDLARKHRGLKLVHYQRKQIQLLQAKVAELKPVVSAIFCRNNALKDAEVKGHLVYLLNLKDHFSMEVKRKKEVLQLKEEQIKKLLVKLCALNNEYSKSKKRLPRKQKEFQLLENMSDRMNQLEKRICSLEHENNVLRQMILDLRKFQKVHRKREKDLRARIKLNTEQIQKHLEKAVARYEERDEFMNKIRLYQERIEQDKKKTENHHNAFNLLLQRTQKFEDFETLQNQPREDKKVIEMTKLMDEKRTGLESDLSKFRSLHEAIVHSSGLVDPGHMSVQFHVAEHQSDVLFRHLEELQKEVHATHEILLRLKGTNKKLMKKLGDKERKLQWEIAQNQVKDVYLDDNCFMLDAHRKQRTTK